MPKRIIPKEDITDNEMSVEQAIYYLKNVIKNWENFISTHSQFTKALKVVLNEIENNKIF